MKDSELLELFRCKWLLDECHDIGYRKECHDIVHSSLKKLPVVGRVV